MAIVSRPIQYADTSADIVRKQLRGERSDWTGRVFQALMFLALLFCLLVLAVLLVDRSGSARSPCCSPSRSA